ncbi:MAG: amidohydrolase [Humibacillus sp.]|nr:amidohydrolase [Humibacillus sp.]
MTEPVGDDLSRLRLADWAPRRQLRAPSTAPSRPRAPVVDAHNHLGRWLSDGRWMIEDVPALVDTMDACSVRTVVNLDGLWGGEVTANVDRYDSAHPGRFVTFCQLDWDRLAQPGGTQALLDSLAESVERGARGVKVWKNLGLTVRDGDDLVRPDDPRVVEILTRAGELGLPVLIHTADPIAFFEPLDRHNERLDELGSHPEWWFGDRTRHPSFDTLLDAHAALVLACPGTTFIGAHLGCAAEDLDRVERLLAAAPNYHVDTAGRVGELGRQPRRFARFVADHPDRVLFGTDIYPASRVQYELHVRFFETLDEGFSYNPEREVPSQGRWDVSGLGLDPALLEKVYAVNAERVLGLTRP